MRRILTAGVAGALALADFSVPGVVAAPRGFGQRGGQAPPRPPLPPALPGRPGSPAPPSEPGTARPMPRRLFRTQDLGLLNAPDRDQWQRPDFIMDELHIFDGAIVADVGAAGGWFTIRLARRVGPNGLVIAEDIQPQMLEAITRRVQNERLQNVRTVLGAATDPRLPGDLDAVLIVDAYREIEDPVTLLRNLQRSLKPQGLVGIVDFTPGGGGPGPNREERVDPDTVVRDASAAGLRLIKREAIPPFLFLLVFGKGAGPRGPA